MQAVEQRLNNWKDCVMYAPNLPPPRLDFRLRTHRSVTS